MHPHRRSTPRRSSSLGLLQRSPQLFPLPRHAQLRHRQQIEHGLEVLALEPALLHHELSHRDVLRHRLLGELRSLGVSDPGSEGGDEGGAALEPVLALGAVGFDALDASLREHPGGVRENLQREQKIVRSEEHTSELQSRLHLVCRLLLEKKKKKKNRNSTYSIIQSTNNYTLRQMKH